MGANKHTKVYGKNHISMHARDIRMHKQKYANKCEKTHTHPTKHTYTHTHTKVFYIYIAIITFSIVKIPIYFLRCNE